MTGLLEQLSDYELVLTAAILATTGVWLLAVGVVDVVRSPAEPEAGPQTLDLGPEPPAVVNFLTNGFTLTPEAVPATLLDLAARGVVELEERGPDNYVCRLRSVSDTSLTPYEHSVVELLRSRESGEIVPAEALTTGPEEEASRWFGAFEREVVADAQRRGLSRDNLTKRVFTVLTAAATVPALLVRLLTEWQAAALYMGGAVALLSAARKRHRQRETPAGLAAASRWLGVRESLDQEDAFATNPPIAVGFWKRHLAYGAALGIAPGAIRPIPMGAESDTWSWSPYGGRWHSVRISYPSLLPLAWGRNPLVALGGGLGAGFVAAFVLAFVVPVVLDVFSGTGLEAFAAAVFVIPAVIGGLVALVVIARSLGDLSSHVELTGEILRLRVRGSEEKRRHYVAVDDGAGRHIRALRVEPRVYASLEQHQVVTVSLTRYLRYVRSVAPVVE